MPYVGLSIKGENELRLANGIFADVFNELSRILNFSYTVINPPDGEWGSMKIDGTWSGMVGQLETRNVDFGMHICYYIYLCIVMHNIIS